MSQENKKVTMRFESTVTDNYNEKDDLIFKSPTHTDVYYKTKEDMESVLDVEVGTTAYVENVLDENLSQKRGAHFVYTPNGWKESLLGTHNHENKEILDQLGDICIENLPKGSKKLLTIEQADDVNDNNSFKVKWNEYPDILPEVPSNLKNSTVYLTLENGEYVWKEQIIPTQTFQYRRTLLEEPSRTVLFDNVTFNQADGDEVLLFDGGMMVTDSYTYSNPTIEDVPYSQFTFDNAIFDAGDTITMLVIKNGVKGFMDTIANEYMSKSDVIDLVSKGTITLKDFAKLSSLEGKANLVHSHSNYSKVGHNHDDLYATYHHVHSEYISGAQVYATIGDILSTFLNSDVEITQDDINNLYLEAINKLRDELEGILSEVIDSTYVDNKFNQLMEMLNADDVTIIHNGDPIPLSTYLSLLSEKIDNVKLDTDSVTTTSDIQVSGLIEQGSYVDGDVIPVGSTVQNIITN